MAGINAGLGLLETFMGVAGRSIMPLLSMAFNAVGLHDLMSGGNGLYGKLASEVGIGREWRTMNRHTLGGINKKIGNIYGMLGNAGIQMLQGLKK